MTFNASGSSDPDGTIAKYEWDLDGNGTYETDTGTTPTTTNTYATERTVNVGLRVTDNVGRHRQHDEVARSCGNPPPIAVVHGDAEPGDDRPDGDVQRGRARPTPTARSPSTSGTSTATAPTRPTPAPRRRPRRPTPTDRHRARSACGSPTTAARPARRPLPGHGQQQRRQRLRRRGPATPPACCDYWRMGEAAGPTLADSKGTAHRRRVTGGTFGVPGAVAGRSRTPRRASTASSDYGERPAQPVGHEQADGRVLAEVERVRQRRRAGDGVHAELQRRPPAASWSTRTPRRPAARSASASASGSSRNNVFFARPSAGAWHHYAFVLRHARRRPATQITPYVDGQAGHATRRSTAAPAPGNFANSTLYLMSRAGSAPVRRRRPRRARDLQPAR